jgi:enterochelin esterase-like enzyme
MLTATVALSGTFNGWATDERAEPVSPHKVAVRRFLSGGRHGFKWLWEDDWSTAWGGRGVESVVPPARGVASPGGDDIVINVFTAGEHVFTIDTRTRRWSVDRTEATPELAAAFSPQEALRGPFGAIVARLRENAADSPFGYAWHRWPDLEPFLAEGMFRGFFPIRDGNRVLFVFNAGLEGRLFLAGSMNGWEVGPDVFTRVPGTDLHYLYREFPPHALIEYKLVHEGSWFADPYNRWGEPDGMPVPLFQTGRFNSVLDLGAPGYARGDHVLWIRFPSVLRNHTRDVWVSLPRGYGQGRYPVLYVNDGNEALTRVFLHRRARETFEAAYAEPCILVFVGLASQMDRNHEYCDLDGRAQYADFLAHELVPFIDAQFRTRTDAFSRGIVGASYGGIISYYVGWRYPELFGCVAGQGASFYAQDWDVLNLYSESSRRRLRLYMDSAAPSAPRAPRDNYRSARYAEKVLRAAGYKVKHVVRRDQRHDWGSWQERFPEVLHAFWPAR